MRLSQVGQIASVIARVRAFGQYVQSGQDSDDLAVRSARIRAEFQALLTAPGLDIPRGSLDPYIDFLTAKIVAETSPQAESG